MKLIYLANIRLPTEKAHGIQIMKMCEAFSSQGIEVELVVPWRFNKLKENAFDFYSVKRNFKIRKIFSLDLIPLGIPKIGFWIQSLSFAKSAFLYLLFSAKSGSASGGKKAELIYSRDSFPLYFLGFFKKNFIYELHTFPRNFSLHRGVFKRAKIIVTITHKLKEFLVKKGIDENKILVAPDGVDLKEFDIEISKEDARKKLNLPLDKKIVLYTGHLYKWKGAQILVQASEFLEKDVLIVLVGGTEKDIKKYQIQNACPQSLRSKRCRRAKYKILVVGHRPYKEIPYWLKAADILVLPNSSKSDISREWTSPMKMFEYMASQRPIVASDIPSLREVLNEQNAILVKPDSPKCLAQGVKKALKKPHFSANISKQAYENVKKNTWENRVKKILDYASAKL